MGRPELRWSDVRRKDMKEKGVKIEEEQDRRTWRLNRLNAPNHNREKPMKNSCTTNMFSWVE